LRPWDDGVEREERKEKDIYIGTGSSFLRSSLRIRPCSRTVLIASFEKVCCSIFRARGASKGDACDRVIAACD
jgi:hypothetical protein